MSEPKLEQELLSWLSELGYTPIYGPDIAPGSKAPERSSYQDVLLTERLRSTIDRLNPDIPLAAREDALQQVCNLNIPVPLSANRHFHKLLINGVRVTYQKEGETRGDFVRLIDFGNPLNNDWLAVNQFEVAGEKRSRKPDVVLFINGLPLVLIELKNPVDVNADIWKAFTQVQTYKKDIPAIFPYNEILVISDGCDARMGSLSASEERFMAWRTVDGIEIDPLGQFHGLETLARGLLAPAYFLDYLRFFILFEDNGASIVKKIAGYHQFHAVRAAIQQIIRASGPGGDKKGGVIWHTQGSGKSMTMTCFAGRAMQEPAMKNPTLVVITDRHNLDGQLFGTFCLAESLVRERPLQAETRKDLRHKLNKRVSGGIIFTTIQKFMPGEDEDVFPVLSDRQNIIVMVDEAHRTQYGFTPELKSKAGEGKYSAGYAQHLRDALPNASFLAFTGTPVSRQDRDTRAVFGDYIHTYDIKQSEVDGTTVNIYYEPRRVKLSLDWDKMRTIDKSIEELRGDEEENDLIELNPRWVSLEKIVGSESRLKQVAADLVSHFEERAKAQSGKAMIACMSRDICARLYNHISALRPDWHSDDITKGMVKVIITGSASDKALLQKHIYTQRIRENLENRFKNPDDELRLVIVCDMWLTGFDAPCLHTLYVDKPMKDHNLMQAITRVNRVFKDKVGGLVVDYIGIGNDLEQALKNYAASRGQGRPIIDTKEAYEIVMEKLDILREMLRDFDYSHYLTGGHRLLAQAANHILGIQDGKKRFTDIALAMFKAFTLCCTLDEVKTIRDEVAFMSHIKAILTKRDINAVKQSYAAHDQAIRQLINSTVVTDKVIDLFDAVGLDKPNIGILDEAFLAKVQNLPEKNAAVELLECLLEERIKTCFAANVALEKKFSELLADKVRLYQNKTIETSQVIEALCEIAKTTNEAMERTESIGLTQDELAFYDALADDEVFAIALGDEILKKIAREVTDQLRQNVKVDWTVRENIQAGLRILVRSILKEYKYPADKLEKMANSIIKQAEKTFSDP